MFTISAGFIGDFKLGDNINFNLKILAYIYQRQKDESDPDSWLLTKPAIILIASVCEALLHDIHKRMKIFTKEGVEGIDESVLVYLREKQIEQFDTYIASAKKHQLLGSPSDGIYEELDELRKLRNRTHIQNVKGHFEFDDEIAFSDARKISAEKTLEKMMKTLSSNHPRPPRNTRYVDDFNIPWSEHFPAVSPMQTS